MTPNRRYRAHAKINLFLEVLGRRPDGFHEIRTVYQSIALCDELQVSSSKELVFTCSDPDLPAGEDNLVLRAARMLQKAFSCEGRGARIHLTKAIPVQAGLGGGSSDAAVALLALSDLWGLSLSPWELLPFARALGSDVPFFLWGGTALGLGRGEEVFPLPDAVPLHAAVIVQPKGMPTGEAYRLLDERLTGEKPLPTIDLFVHELVEGRSTLNRLFNRFEEVQPHMEGEVAALRRALRTTETTRMLLAGSGSAWVLVSEREDEVRTAAGRRKDRSSPLILSKTLARREYWGFTLPGMKENQP